MRIAFLCKRHYMAKDVITDRFGRFYEIPRQLAIMGHDVRCWCLAYRRTESVDWVHDDGLGQPRWVSQSLNLAAPITAARYPWRLLDKVRRFGPDLVIGASDIPHLALAAWIARRLDLGLVLDLYDNFESYGQARIPGFIWLLRRAVRRADLTITVSQELRQKVLREYHPRGPVEVVQNAVDASLFRPGDRIAARQALGLAHEARLVGTAGGLARAKGVGVLYAAWPRIQEMAPNAQLVLAGPADAGLRPPAGHGIRYLGVMPQERVALLFRALDVGVVTVADDAFGRYCYPQKAVEMLACGLPVVATNVGVMRGLMLDTPESLYEPGDSEGLATAVLRQLDRPTLHRQQTSDWRELVANLEPSLVRVASVRSAGPSR